MSEARHYQPKIDVHLHYLPPDYRRAAEAAGHQHPDGMPRLPDWDVETALSMMDGLNIRTAMLSVVTPGVHFGDDAAACALARSVNEQGAAAVAAHPGRFGLFAALPLPDVDGAVDEAAYAFDYLAADGVVVLTNQSGLYLGDPRLDPSMTELDRRRAVLFMHPSSPHCPGCLGLALGQPRPVLEFIFDTTRTVLHLPTTRILDRFPNIRWIVPHAGGAIPVLADRIAGHASLLHADDPLTPDYVFASLKRLHYDMAGFPLPRLASATLQIADPERLHYGSDWPFTPLDTVTQLAGELDATPIFDDVLRRRIFMDNSVALFPRLARQRDAGF
jgi:predicted TIM-barrel fold metal-dependent hydrolase